MKRQERPQVDYMLIGVTLFYLMGPLMMQWIPGHKMEVSQNENSILKEEKLNEETNSDNRR